MSNNCACPSPFAPHRLFCNEIPAAGSDKSPRAGSSPPTGGMLAHTASIHWQTLAEWSRGLGGSQYLLIISEFEPHRDTSVYTHRKSPANLRAIFQKGEELPSEFPHLISGTGSASPWPPGREGLRRGCGQASISCCYRTPPVPFEKQDPAVLETAGSNFGARPTSQKLLLQENQNADVTVGHPCQKNNLKISL